MFRGREMSHTELGRKLLDRLTEDLQELATVDAYPKLDGRNMVMVLAPVKRQPPKGEEIEEAEGRLPTAADDVAEETAGEAVQAEPERASSPG
jgi:translation initiation factor IF-3